MKKLFLNLNILISFTLTGVGAVACNNRTYSRNYDSTNDDVKIYDMGQTKDFKLETLPTIDFQLLANDKISKQKRSSSELEEQIKNKIFETIFEQITGNKIVSSDELKALKEINFAKYKC